VTQSDGNYAQCVDCDETSFQNSCSYWGTELLAEAQEKCDLTCAPVAPVGLACESDADCPDSSSTCVIQADGDYAQCISCDASDYQENCGSYTGAFKKAAAKACEIDSCTGSDT